MTLDEDHSPAPTGRFQLARVSARGFGARGAPGRPEHPERISPNKTRERPERISPNKTRERPERISPNKTRHAKFRHLIRGSMADLRLFLPGARGQSYFECVCVH